VNEERRCLLRRSQVEETGDFLGVPALKQMADAELSLAFLGPAREPGSLGWLDHYEVRSWVGWHHHMTLSLVALWFLCLERRRVGGENPGGDGPADPADLQSVAPETSGAVGSDRGGSDTCSAA